MAARDRRSDFGSRGPYLVWLALAFERKGLDVAVEDCESSCSAARADCEAMPDSSA